MVSYVNTTMYVYVCDCAYACVNVGFLFICFVLYCAMSKSVIVGEGMQGFLSGKQ